VVNDQEIFHATLIQSPNRGASYETCSAGYHDHCPAPPMSHSPIGLVPLTPGNPSASVIFFSDFRFCPVTIKSLSVSRSVTMSHAVAAR
jgi:hypothetical protein